MMVQKISYTKLNSQAKASLFHGFRTEWSAPCSRLVAKARESALGVVKGPGMGYGYCIYSGLVEMMGIIVAIMIADHHDLIF